MRASRILRECGVPHSLVLNQYRVIASEELSDIFRVLQWGDGVELSRCGGSATYVIKILRLTMLPMTRTRPLNVVRLKIGKGSTERTGHLGTVALILSIHMSECTG